MPLAGFDPPSPSKQSASDPRSKPHGHRDWLLTTALSLICTPALSSTPYGRCHIYQNAVCLRVPRHFYVPNQCILQGFSIPYCARWPVYFTRFILCNSFRLSWCNYVASKCLYRNETSGNFSRLCKIHGRTVDLVYLDLSVLGTTWRDKQFLTLY
jgi:hypothetical protein